MLEKAGAVAVGVLIIAVGTWLGLVVGVAVGGRRDQPRPSGRARRAPGLLRLRERRTGAGARGASPGGGRSPPAAPRPSRVVGFLINGFAPLVDGVSWLKFASPFYYYAGHDPLGSGIHLGDLAVLAAAAAVLTAIAAVSFRRRDLRG